MTDLVQASLGWHRMIYETAHVCTSLHAGGAPTADSRPALLQCLHATALSNPPGQRPRATPRPRGVLRARGGIGCLMQRDAQRPMALARLARAALARAC